MKLAIVVEGGIVQGIFANKVKTDPTKFDICVIDYDETDYQIPENAISKFLETSDIAEIPFSLCGQELHETL